MYSNNSGLFGEAKKGKLPNIFSALILTVFFIYGGQYIGSFILAPLNKVIGDNKILLQINNLFWGNLVGILLVAIRVKFFEKRKFSSIGFYMKNFIAKYLLGFLLGFIMFSSVVIILKFTGHIVSEVSNDVEIGMSALSGVLLVIPAWIIQSANEEIVTRGWLMNVLGAKYNVAIGLIVSAAIFGVLHLLNPNVSIVALINIILVGLFLGLLIIKTETLWIACGIHAAWNWSQGNLYGFEVSGGKAIAGNLFGYKLVGPEWFTGGSFGPEAGLAATIILGLSIVILLIMTKNKKFS